jgi:hypothetical protein
VSLEIALAQATMGRKIFPLAAKRPLVQWTVQATTNESVIRRWWTVWPDAGVAWRHPEGLVIVDSDDETAMIAAGRPAVPAHLPRQQATRGPHYLYQMPGAIEVKQGPIPGGDLKVGGKGYVKIYSADAFATGTLEPLPDWYVQARGSSTRRAAAQRDPYEVEEIGTRTEILEWLGRIAAYVGLAEKEYYGLLLGAAASGRIVDQDETRPWTEADLRVLAHEAAAWTQAERSGPVPVIRRLRRGPWRPS